MTIHDTPPHDIAAEEALIGCVMQRHEAYKTVSAKVTANMFHVKLNEYVYAHITSMHDKDMSVNAETLTISLAEKKVNVTVEYLNRCMNSVPILKNADYFADIVVAKYKARELIKAAHNIETIAKEATSENIFKIMVKSEEIIDGIAKGYKSGIDYYTEDQYKKERAEMSEGLAWGYTPLDAWCTIPVGRSAYIGSVSNGGKSTFMFNVAHSLSVRGHKVAIFTYEDSRNDSAMRMNYLHYMHIVRFKMKGFFPEGVETKEIPFWEYKNRVKNKINKFDEIDDMCLKMSLERIFFFDNNLMVDEIETYVKHILHEHKELDVLFLDYLQIIPTNDDAGYLKMKSLVNGLNEIARRYRVSIISACQMTVNEYDTEKKDYMKISRVREARDIFHSCSLFLGLHNQTQFDSQVKGIESVDNSDTGTIDILKNKTKDGIEKKNIPFELDRAKLFFKVKYV